jgi:type VI secretion system protein ImpK
MELCMPVFGYATMLPREASGTQPDYEAFRKEILAALQRVEHDASEYGIEAEDAREASYALSLFLDEQVEYSEWQGKTRWSAEPLHIVLHQDAEGGENFFRRLEALSNRQRDVKEVYLVCLALGYRGKYADLDPAQQAARIGEIRQKILRSIHPVPLDKQPVLFPDAYRDAAPVVDAVPPAPRWWVMASGATIVGVLVLWLILFWVAGWLPRAASERLRQVQFHRAPVQATPATAATPAPGPSPEAAR